MDAIKRLKAEPIVDHLHLMHHAREVAEAAEAAGIHEVGGMYRRVEAMHRCYHEDEQRLTVAVDQGRSPSSESTVINFSRSSNTGR